MKHRVEILAQYLPWLVLLLGVDGFAVLMLWVGDVKAFDSIAAIIFITTIFMFFTLCCVLLRLERRREEAFLAFLDDPNEYHQEKLLGMLFPSQRKAVRLVGQILREKDEISLRGQEQLENYKEYVESWAHEIKTPLSLLTFLLDNRRDELPLGVDFKLDYIRNRMQESVDQMLFYARLKGGRKDYLFQHIDIALCAEEVLEDYQPLLEEKHFQIHRCLSDGKVYSDRRGLRFLLGQIISNAIKYSGKEPELFLDFVQKEKRSILTIRDNGMGVRSCDLPYIFEWGFTGDSGDSRKKATGMGLYLAKEMAKDLNLSLDASSQWGKGFEMQISFPVVDHASRGLKK